VGFPEDELTKDERVVLHLHPHWKQVFWPFALVIAVIAAVVVTWVVTSGGIALIIAGAVGLVLLVWFTLIPYIKWRTTHYVVTNDRIITRVGIFSQHTENINIDRVSDVQFDQSLFQRILGCGKLQLSSAGEHGPDVLNNIPHIKTVVVTMNELIGPGDGIAPQRRPANNDGQTQEVER
jgi:uncharacterized membrane protein YdbT with pleckstrin-like domain